jgi:hypothetical protein
MRVLFDKSAPYGLAPYLEGHVIGTTEEHGWEQLGNGVLLATAEAAVHSLTGAVQDCGVAYFFSAAFQLSKRVTGPVVVSEAKVVIRKRPSGATS